MSLRHLVINIILLTGLFFRFSALAQSVPDTIHITEVKVFRQENITKQVLSFSELDSFTLNQNSSTNLSDLLIQNSTIYIKSTGRGTLSTASFRGTDPSHTKIYWNGLIINSPMLGQSDLTLIPGFFLDKVSLYHGGSSLSTGSGAIGGIIALDNKPAWNNKNSFSLINELASFGTYQGAGKLEVKNNKWISKSRIFYSRSENNYPFYNQKILPPENQRLQNSQYSSYGFLQELYFRTRRNNLFSMKLWLQHADRNLPQPLSRETSDVSESQYDTNVRSVFSWKHYGKAGEYEVSSGFISDKINYTLAQSTDGNINIDSRSMEKSFINRFDYSFNINPKTISRLQILYNWYDVGITEKIRSEGYKANRSELSVMAGLNREFGKRLSAFLLFRYNLVDRDFIPVMPSLGFALKLLRETELYLKTNMSRNYNIPGLNDMYWIPGGNPELKPEESYTADLALDFKQQNDLFMVNSSITGYFSRINGWIIWKPTQYQYWAPENVALVFSRGLEFSLKTSTHINSSKIIFQVNYNLCKTTEPDGQQLIYIPVNSFNTWAGVIFKGYQVDFRAGYTGKRYTQTKIEEGTSEAVLEPYFLGDVSMSKEVNMHKFRLNFNLSVRNLFNKEYQVVLARPMPGRNYSLNIGLSL